jgi:hypothetical protein
MLSDVGDKESIDLREAGKQLSIAYTKWEEIDIQRNIVSNELHKIEDLILFAKQKLDEITVLADLFYISIKQEYDTIIESHKTILTNFKLITEKLNNAEIEYTQAKHNFDAAEIVCDKIAAHSIDA